MKLLSGKELARLVEAHGWTLRRIHGSHHIYAKPSRSVRLSIPIHGNRSLRPGLQRHLLNLAEIMDDER